MRRRSTGVQPIRQLQAVGRPAAVAFLAAVGPALGGVAALGVAYGVADTLRAGGWAVAGGLLLVGALGCGLSVLPTHVLSLVAGWSLGAGPGTLLAVGAATLGAPLGYAVGGWLAGPGLLVWAERYPKAAAVCGAIGRAGPGRAFGLLALLRLSPVVPYGVTNVLAAVFRLPVMPFVAGTAVGLAPRVAVVAAWGAALEQLDAGTSPVGGWTLAAGAVATLGAVVLLGAIARRAVRAVADPATRDA